ncbi:ribosomal RNA small subunit methyltransferase I [Mycolicibacterium phlei]|jgi:16S rRNA (cytidine1402-2'-O)-methyltransferase|uniref:Ribosomal RNA small subunit methyltransferase I n=1 Tax=Mycobacteroides chelonae TaxID=1774 RepID=A0A0E3XNB6_MYCCH|nr:MULTISPECIES: 16S rRNA (cytidine(1402)-2'-O)-methyltransferase [Mycobacteroides]VEG15264.1 ribosomal RNA small subunit methyltransferase I [Mycolicibacterium phlei]AKC38069.1 16S rRNA methyltransferase [Mycobacteroides chelonae]ANA97271.1 16S rRNA methyltransferase [Mycobacteroides chelonae CCUG 47445]KRQ26731.1 16S rRNA methyltransferase [Mycobacteroides sp. H003]KRQ28586.1 16S rRNA methyltransferase [Mycobacteroides sp. H092]
MGNLLLAATPLGEPGDASPRLREALAKTAVVAAEDTRRVRALAKSLDVQISGQIISFYDQNEASRIEPLLADLEAGYDVLVVTDAGMPSISDPGYRLVAACVKQGIPIKCLPGPSAVTTALAVSGLPVDRFCFEGFAPRKQGARRRWLAELSGEPRTCVFFESPRRLAETLADAVEVLGPERRAAVCRELTKTHEEVLRGTLRELAVWAEGEVLGEITVVLDGGRPAVPEIDTLVTRVEELMDDGMGLRESCAMAIGESGATLSRRDLYDAVVKARA